MVPDRADEAARPDEEAGDPVPSRRDRILLGLLVAAAAVGTYVGFRVFYFLTDDAYITFRYVSNAMAGYGLVWNPPPFLPVEGYTSLLWALILWAVWAVTGVMPPEASGWISLGLGYATLALGVRMIWRMELPPRMQRIRLPMLALVLTGTVANRTFLTWLSSGLETSLFNFTLTWWLSASLARPERRGDGWALSMSLAASAAALTRPGGVLCVAATCLVLVHEQLRQRRRPSLRRVAAAAPLLLIPAHFGFRRVFYGEWLPNTYYAKLVGAWPESGVRYLASFVLENGFWVWLLLALAAAAFSARRVPFRSLLNERFAPVVGVLTLAAHFAYYTLVVGGDHFEYRVYSHLILLGFVSAAWFATRIRWRPWAAVLAMALFVSASLPIGWAHWSQTHTIEQRRFKLRVPVAQLFPAPLRPPVEAFDRMQHWLITHYVCMRWREHRQFWIRNVTLLPSRDDGAQIPWRRRPILAIQAVGVIGWVLPHVAVIDALGLNDYVVARTGPRLGHRRAMAHDRRAPPGYLDCFRPSVRANLSTGRVWESRRRIPVTDATIEACERRFRARLSPEEQEGLLRRVIAERRRLREAAAARRRRRHRQSQRRNASTAMTASGESSETTMRADAPDHSDTSQSTTER